MSERDSPRKVREAQQHLADAVERFRTAEGVAPAALRTWALIEELATSTEPAVIIVMLTAALEYFRRDAHAWMLRAVDHPADDSYRAEVIHLGVDDALDKLEESGLIVTELLADVTPATARVTDDGHIVIEDESGQFLSAYEIIQHNAPGSEDLN